MVLELFELGLIAACNSFSLRQSEAPLRNQLGTLEQSNNAVFYGMNHSPMTDFIDNLIYPVPANQGEQQMAYEYFLSLEGTNP